MQAIIAQNYVGQKVLDAAGLAFADFLAFLAIFTWPLTEMMSLTRIMQAQGGMKAWMLMTCKCLGTSPDADVATERVVPSVRSVKIFCFRPVYNFCVLLEVAR
jgi:hypothetical protein